jgi:protocatechuate 3,4-dioxygenase beta subunit
LRSSEDDAGRHGAFSEDFCTTVWHVGCSAAPDMSTRIKLDRRQLLAALGAGVSAAAAAACTSSPTTPTSTGGTSSNSGGTSSTCAITPSETAGPYPDRLGMLTNSAFHRRDVTEGKPGLPLTLTLTIVNANANCAPLSGLLVEIWQCDAGGNYSEYSQPGFNGVGQTFQRGLQTTDASRQVTFTTVYPGWYAGRATHIHVDVYRNSATVKTTQIAFPEDLTRAVYATGVYAAKGQSSTTNASDNVFSDGTQLEMATLTGNTTSGYTATLTIGLAG